MRASRSMGRAQTNTVKIKHVRGPSEKLDKTHYINYSTTYVRICRCDLSI
ncbi:hypothetical protein HanRHA438_Chr12g0552051 [Helianthus annuus]|nr:hypothetical protein HanRHA438_Chr12g0552051 [Helianthus annuus]